MVDGWAGTRQEVSMDDDVLANVSSDPATSHHLLPRKIYTQSRLSPLKDVVDFILSGALLVFLAPLIATVAVAIKIDSPGPVFFRQRRVGRHWEEFTIYKFRTMYANQSSEDGGWQATRDDSRVTAMGRFLRRSSIDEIPQLINILLGEMSLIGPRPHAIGHHKKYLNSIADYEMRLCVKPGISGWAQIHGLRGETRRLSEMEKRVSYDLYYIGHWSVWFDLKIMLLTVLWVRSHSRAAY